MNDSLTLGLRSAVVFTVMVCITGCAVKKARIPTPAPERVSIEKKDGLTELLGEGSKIFARYTTYKRPYETQDFVMSPDYLQGKIVGREIEICFENPQGEVRVVKRLQDDKELKAVNLITRFRYNPSRNLLAFTTDRRGNVFIISVKNGKLMQTIDSAVEPRWSVDGSRLFYTDTQDEQEKELILSP